MHSHAWWSPSRRRFRFHTAERSETVTDASNPGQLHVRLSRFLPLDIKRSISPNLIDECCKTAWANGWRDAEWLAGYALEGTGMANVTNAAAMFTARLRDIASTPCPQDDTPTPPRAYVDPAPSGPPARPETVASALAECRKAISR